MDEKSDSEGRIREETAALTNSAGHKGVHNHRIKSLGKKVHCAQRQVCE